MVDDPNSLVALNRAQGASETDPFTPERYRQFAKLLPGGTDRVLDVGCNVGRGGAALKTAAPGVRLHGLDLLPERVAQIPLGLYEDVSIGLLDACVPPPGGFDAVLMGEVIEHVPWAAFDGLLSDVLRVLRPGGVVLMTTPNPHWILLRRVSGNTVLGGPHVSAHCARALAQYLTYRGFEVYSLTGTGRVSTRLGRRPPLPFYGAYMLAAKRPA
jgi:2-polyprenyl-3-methyl-5-hydroxy-6-metoxy-1,4-benzoquinol methylase